MRKIALDADPGVADALTLAFALFDPNVEIVAATSVGGFVDPRTAARNLQSLVAFLDPPRLPRIGVGAVEKNVDLRNDDARAPFAAPASFLNDSNAANAPNNLDDFNGCDGFAFPVVERLASRPAASALRDAVRTHPYETSILALGPLTNVARAFRRDPELPFLLNRLVVAGGGFFSRRRGNVAEFNLAFDPQAARVVFQAPCAKTFVPLDAASELVFTFDDLRSLDPRGDVGGEFVRRAFLKILLDRRRDLGSEVAYLQEFAAYFALVEPSLCSTVEAFSDDEIFGDAPLAPVDAQRPALANRRPDVEIVRQIDADAVRQKIVDAFQRIAARSRPF